MSKYLYGFRTITLPSQFQVLIMEIFNESQTQTFPVVSAFIMDEVGVSSDSVMTHLQNVLTGKAEKEEFKGYTYSLSIEKEYTLVYCHVDYEGKEQEYTIETQELVTLIEAWVHVRGRMQKIKKLV